MMLGVPGKVPGTLGHWRVKTGLSDEGMGGDGSNHWHYASGRSLCHSVPKLERRQPCPFSCAGRSLRPFETLPGH